MQLEQALLFGGDMKNQIFKTKRIGIIGNKPLGAEYMAEVNERARRMNAAAKEEAADQRQLKLPIMMRIKR